MTVARLVAIVLATYVGIGLVFGVLFVTRGAGRVDPAARGGPLAFRLLILPGAAGLWPYLLLRWLRADRADTPR